MMRLGSTHEGDWWRVAKIVKGIAREAEDLSCFRGRNEGGGDNSGMRFEHFDGSFVLFGFWLSGGPNVGFAIFAATDDVLGIITERGMYLTTRVLVALQLEFQTLCLSNCRRGLRESLLVTSNLISPLGSSGG